MPADILRLAAMSWLVAAIAMAGITPALAQRLADRWQDTAAIAMDAADGAVDGLTSDAEAEPIDPAILEGLEAGIALTLNPSLLEGERSTAATIVDPRAAAPLLGIWRGAYDCAQGITGMTLSLAQWPEGEVEGVMHFYPTEGGTPGVPRGSYAVRILSGDRHAFVEPIMWLQRPEGYTMVGMTAFLDKKTGLLSGKVDYEGCSDFVLSRLP